MEIKSCQNNMIELKKCRKYQSEKPESAWDKLKSQIKDMLDMHIKHNKKMRLPSLRIWNSGVIAGLQIALGSIQKIEKKINKKNK